MIREVLVLSTWLILAGALPFVPPDISDAHAFSNLKSEAELRPTADPESTTDLDSTDVDLIVDLGPMDAVLSPIVLDSADALKLNTGLYVTGAEVPAVDLDPANPLQLNTSLHLTGSAVPADDLDSTSTVELIIDLFPVGAAEGTTDVSLEAVEVLKFLTDMKSNITSFMKETTDGATVDYNSIYTGNFMNEDYQVALVII